MSANEGRPERNGGIDKMRSERESSRRAFLGKWCVVPPLTSSSLMSGNTACSAFILACKRRKFEYYKTEDDSASNASLRYFIRFQISAIGSHWLPCLPIVDPEGLPVEQVGEALCSVALNDPLAAVETAEAEHVAAIESAEGLRSKLMIPELLPFNYPIVNVNV